MLARALALEPAVLLLDEPTSALDEAARDAVERTLLGLRERLGVSFVLVTHDSEQAARMADWVCGSQACRQGADASRELAHRRQPRRGRRSLALVAVAIAVSLWERADLERDIAVAVARSFVQLSAIGYVINFIFDEDRLVFVVALLAAMVVFGALTARNRARNGPERVRGRC